MLHMRIISGSSKGRTLALEEANLPLSIGRDPENAGLLTRTMLIGQAVSESTGIYSLVVALLMLFVVGA